MGFIEDLRRYLVARDRNAERVGQETVRRAVWHAVGGIADPEAREFAFKTWLGQAEAVRELAGWVELVLDECPFVLTDVARALSIEKVVCAAVVGGWTATFDPVAPLEEQWFREAGAQLASRSFFGLGSLSFADYAREVRLADECGLTRLGNVFVALVGREALEFLLELEVALSTGRFDEIRISRVHLAALRSHGFPEGGAPTWLIRWNDVGVFAFEFESGEPRYTVDVGMEDLVDRVLDGSGSPFRAVVRGLLDQARDAAAAPERRTAGGGIDLTRTVVHEVRNTLLPLESALQGLWAELERGTTPDPVAMGKLRERSDRSLGRLRQFTDQFATLLEAVPEDVVGLRAVIEDAVAQSAADRNGRIAVESSADDARIPGSRPLWVLAFVNLLRNAAQSRADEGTVWIGTEWTAAGTLRVLVDDDGKGIPEELREAVFRRGHSLRGGSGQGLADVRVTVERVGGTVVCEASPRGGARFVLHVPTARPA